MTTPKHIAEKHCILRLTVGSTLHGLAIGSDDRDEMGVCVEPPDYVVGLEQFEQWTYRTKPQGVRSGPGDLDLVIYSLRKWCRLALKGNPTIMLLLFAPKEFQLVSTTWGDELQALAPALVSRHVAKSFLGYMQAQRRGICKQRNFGGEGHGRSHREQLVEQYGYDTKYAMHLLRLGYQGKELLQTGRMTLPVPDDIGSYLISVRQGKRPASEVLEHAISLENDLIDLKDKSPLPPKPDKAKVNQFLFRVYNEVWEKGG